MAMHEPTFFILTALVRVPLHGYGIMQAVDELSQGRVTLRAGTLYAALERLTADGLIEPEREEAVDGRLRRYYRLTDRGTAALEAEVARMRSNATIATARLRAALNSIQAKPCSLRGWARPRSGPRPAAAWGNHA